MLWFLCAGLTSFAQEMVNIKGQVFSSEDKTTIPGASVYVDKSTVGEYTSTPGVVQNSAIGTITDTEGRFSLNVPKGTEYLSISFLGFNSRRVLIVNKASVKVFLETAKSELNAVIVTGYTDIQKRKNTVAAAKVKMADINQAGVAGVDQMLQGQLAGVVVSPTNGGPNAATKIRIRGTASIQGTQDPLWVLDGMPLEGTSLPLDLLDKNNIDELRNLPISGLNTEDIADITVLKDAAATAIYGARAANGVIVITTKKGKAGNTHINFSANAFVSQRPDFSKLNLLNSDQKVDLELGLAAREDLTFRDNKGAVSRILNNAGELDALRQGGFNALSQSTQGAINRLRNTNTNWGRQLYDAALNQQYNLSLSGGNEKANYYFSAGYYNEKGATIGTGLERYNATLKTDFHIAKNLTFGVGIFGVASKNKGYLTDADAFINPARYSRNANPYLAIYNADGSYNYDQDIEGFSDRYVPFNMIEERNNTKNTLGTQSIKALFDVNYKIIPELTLKSQFGIQFDNTGAEKFADANTYYVRKLRESTRYYDSATKKYLYNLPVGGTIMNQDGTLFQYNWKTMLNYNKTFGKHEIDAMVGSELRRVTQEQITTRGFGFDPQTLTTKPFMFRNADEANNANFRGYAKAYGENAFASFFTTVSYTYDHRYTLFGSLRYDGSDLFGVDPKYRWLPIWSVSGAWNAKSEDFLKDVSWLSNLRARASYGIQGNIDKNTSPFVVGAYNTSTIISEGEQVIGVTNPPNGKLRWEKTKNFNAGVDFGVFNNRIQLTVDYYNRNSSDLVALQAVPLENGFEFLTVNWGEINNRGYEITLSTNNIHKNNFDWSTDFNFAHNASKVNQISVRETSRTPSTLGYPVNAVFGLRTAGLDKDGIPQFLGKDGSVIKYEDFYKLSDQMPDIMPGELVQSDLSYAEYRNLFTYLGNRDPKFVGGLNNRFRYKNFDLAIAASFTLNQLGVRAVPYNPAEVDRGQNYTTDILNAWTPTNTNTMLPAIFSNNSYQGQRWMAAKFLASGGDEANSFNNLDVWTRKLNYVRINSIRLGYTLPAAIANKIKASSVRLNVEGRNLFVFSTNYKGFFDPESYGNIYAQPLAKTYTIGLNVAF